MDALQADGAGVHLAHPLGVKAFEYRRHKDDERDAKDLADLLRRGRLPDHRRAPPANMQVSAWPGGSSPTFWGGSGTEQEGWAAVVIGVAVGPTGTPMPSPLLACLPLRDHGMPKCQLPGLTPVRD